jgi:hypothetical protein
MELAAPSINWLMQTISPNGISNTSTRHRIDGPAAFEDTVGKEWWYCGFKADFEEQYWDAEWREHKELQLTTQQFLLLLDEFAELEHLNSLDEIGTLQFTLGSP